MNLSDKKCGVFLVWELENKIDIFGERMLRRLRIWKDIYVSLEMKGGIGIIKIKVSQMLQPRTVE